MKNILPLEKIISISNNRNDKSIGLIVGSFDILHMGHINLFRFAKKHVDILIVGLDNDKTIKNTKGDKRPINEYKRRSSFLSEIKSIDYIFKIEKVFKHGDRKSFIYFKKLFTSIKPTHMFTSVKCDDLWKEKKKFAQLNNIKFVPEKTEVIHTTKILEIIENEF